MSPIYPPDYSKLGTEFDATVSCIACRESLITELSALYEGTPANESLQLKAFPRIEDFLEQSIDEAPERNVIIIDQCLLDNSSLPELLQITANHPNHFSYILASSQHQVDEIEKALEMGIFFFIIEPFSQKLIKTTVDSALNTELSFVTQLKRFDPSRKLPSLVEQADFHFKTPNEAQTIAVILGFISPHPNKVSLGLFELMLNAIEHGNLGIGYAKKAVLLETGELQNEIQRRLALPENQDKSAKISLRRTEQLLEFKIQDQGKGFDASPYLCFDEGRALEKNGRGIMIANCYSFDELEFQNRGSTVIARVYL